MPRILVGWITFTNHNIRFAMVVPWAPLSLQALLRNHVSVVWPTGPTASSPRAETNILTDLKNIMMRKLNQWECKCIRISLCIDLHTHRCIFRWFIHVYIYIYDYIYMYIYIYIYTCVYVSVCVLVQHMHVSLYIYICICIWQQHMKSHEGFSNSAEHLLVGGIDPPLGTLGLPRHAKTIAAPSR